MSPLSVRADLKTKVVFVWKIWTRSLLFLFSLQSSLENSGSTEKLKMRAHMLTHAYKTEKKTNPYFWLSPKLLQHEFG